jgi:hypothetical protein
MNKIFIASLVAAIILFAWQALSWMLMPIHLHSFQYTTSQDSILNVLKNSGLSTGAYLMPSVDNRNVHAFDAEYQKKNEELMKTSVGKPMATIFFTAEMPGMNGVQFFYGFLYVFIAALCACLLLSLAYQSSASYWMRWWMVMLFAIVYIVLGPLTNHNWMMEPWHYTIGFIADALISWGLAGLWIAKYLKKVDA